MCIQRTAFENEFSLSIMDQILVVSLGSRHLYLLSHLTSLKLLNFIGIILYDEAV